MAYDFDAFREDLTAAMQAVNEEDFQNLNIFANRIMSNSIFGGEKKLILPGFFLKDVSIIGGSLKIKTLTTDFAVAQSNMKQYMNELLKKTENESFDQGELWEHYSNFRKKIRKFWMTPFESKSYLHENNKFTRTAFKWLILYSKEHLEILQNPNNQLLKGVLNEMSRLFNAHGGELWEIYALSLFTSLDRCNDYARVAFPGEDFAKGIQKEVFPLVEETVSLLSQDSVSVASVSDLIWELTRKWREYFIQFMEVYRTSISPGYQPEKGIEIPEETKEKLAKSITKSLEQEPKSKKLKSR